MNGVDAPSSGSVSWRDVRAELLRRINERIWRPGEMIPNEAELAAELACARATVSRALRDLADQGLVTRRRRAGTQVALNPAARATLRIPIIREEVEAAGLRHRHVVLQRDVLAPPAPVQHRLELAQGAKALKVRTIHLAQERPYALDERWINLQTTPAAAEVLFDEISANEWLVQNAPYTRGDLAVLAENASHGVAEQLDVAENAAIVVIERSTWCAGGGITTTRISFASGYRIQMAL